MDFHYKKEIEGTFALVLPRVKEALLGEGFGIISEIDVRNTIKKKLGKDFDDYTILGACNPSFAHTALLIDRDIGLFMPCNVIVYERQDMPGRVVIAAVRSTFAMSVVENPEIKALAETVEEKLKKAVDAVA